MALTWTCVTGTSDQGPEERGVFTEDLLTTYIDYKREKEVNAMRQRPHPYEFALYYDI